MDSPREVKIAIALSWTALVIEVADRWWRLSNSSDAYTFARLRLVWAMAILSSTVLVALLIFFTSRRHNWARVALLLFTFGGWCLWFFWMREVAEYAWWQWLTLGTATVMELGGLVLLFSGKGAAWYHAAPSASYRAL